MSACASGCVWFLYILMPELSNLIVPLILPVLFVGTSALIKFHSPNGCIWANINVDLVVATSPEVKGPFLGGSLSLVGECCSW